MKRFMSYYEGLLTLFISFYIIWLLYSGKFSLMFNPKFRILAVINADLLFVLGLYTLVYPGRTNFGRITALTVIVIFMFLIKDFSINPDFMLQLEVIK